MRYVYYPDYKPIQIGPFNTSKTELKQISIAWLAISFAFANLLRANLGFIAALVISAVTVGTGFFLHEMSHKITAQRFGCVAEFRAFYNMLVFAVFMSFLGFVFAAPGAVMIAGHPNRKQNGIISLAGPITNLVFAYLFFFVRIFAQSSFVRLISSYGFMINTWLALFNLLPFGNFDGRKVLLWNKYVYGTAIGIAVLMFISTMLV